MDPLEETRMRLEAQVSEFFSSSTPNERKQQIGPLLENFSKQSGSWKQALYFLGRREPVASPSPFLTMFCITVVENSVKLGWSRMSPQEKGELYSTLYTFLLEGPRANFVRNKVVKILTDVGKLSWPQDHPQFLENVLKIASNQETVVLGLLFLKTMSEEWSTCKDEVSTDRKLELKMNLVREMKRIFEVLHRILAAGLPYIKPADGKVDGHLKEVLALSLETCAHLFTWIPFDGVVLGCGGDTQQKVVPFGVDFVQVLCKYTEATDMRDVVNDGEGFENLAILGLNVLNELLYRKYIPRDFEGHLTIVVNFVVDLLHTMMMGTNYEAISHKYVDKGLETLCLVANSYFFRYNKETAERFITVLQTFTFAQNETEFYYECLEVWKILLDHLLSEIPFLNFPCREDLMECFKPVLLELAHGIVSSSIKFDIDEDSHYYEDEDDEDVDGTSLSKNVDVLVKIGELFPTESLERVAQAWASSFQFFENLRLKLDQTKTAVVFENQTDIKHFSFIVQLIGRLAEIFSGEVFKNEIDRAKQLIQQLLRLSLISKELYFVRSQESLVQANCEIIYALRAWTYWLSRYHSEVILADCTTTEAQQFFEILSLCVEGLRFALEHHGAIDRSITLAHANLFTLAVSCIRSPYMFKLPWVQTLVHNIHTLQAPLTPETYRILNKGVASLLLLPWQNCSSVEQEWESRTSMYREYMKTLMNDAVAAANCSDVPKLLMCIHILNDQLEVIQVECAASKKICWSFYQEVVQFMHKLVPAYIKRCDVSEEILNFFLKVMEVLRQQAGIQFFEETIRVFLGLFTSAHIISDLMKDIESSSVVVEKFIQMLQFMIKDPSPSFKKFLPSCLSVSLDHIYPVLAQRPSPDIKLIFFQFIRDVVNYRWNYFFPGFLYASTPSGSPSSISEDDAEVSRRLHQIFQTIGQSFLQSDLEIFRFNLNTLSVWNQKNQIYSRMTVDLKMFDGFMAVYLQVLANKSHDLLREDIAFNLYEMALVDYQRFWQVFLPQTLQKDFPTLTTEQRNSLAGKFRPKDSNISRIRVDKMDLTGFTMTLYKFIDDLRFFHFHNECTNSNDPAKLQTALSP